MRPEKQPLQLSDNEKVIFEILKTEKKMELDVLKTKADLSNKAWDKGIKGITKHQLAKIYKNGDVLFVEILS
jgi:lysyl-tRNA synthetase class 2